MNLVVLVAIDELKVKSAFQFPYFLTQNKIGRWILSYKNKFDQHGLNRKVNDNKLN